MWNVTYMLSRPQPCSSLPVGPRGAQMLLHTGQPTCVCRYKMYAFPLVKKKQCFGISTALRNQLLWPTWHFGHGLAPLACRTHQKLQGAHPSALVSRQLPPSGPAAHCPLPAGPEGTAAPKWSSASFALPLPAAAAPAVQTSSPPSGSNDLTT